MATRKSAASARSAKSARSPRSSKSARSRKAGRWNDPPRRGNPLGLLLILIGAAGLLYAACTRKPGVSLSPAPRAAQQSGDTVVPHGRYVPPHRVRVAEAKPDEQPDSDKAPRETVKTEETDAPKAGNPSKTPEAADAPDADTGTTDAGATDATAETPADDTKNAAPATDDTGTVDVTEDAPKPAPPKEVDEPAVTLPPAPAAPAKPAVQKPEISVKPAQKPVRAPARELSRARRASAVSLASGEFERNPNATGVVALSFDGCYDDKPLPEILSALQRRGYRATFFIAGKFASRYPKSVQRISDAGMEIGNHSWSHPKFTKLSDAGIDSQLNRTNDLIKKLTGKTPTLFRPPFGDRDPRVRREVADDGFRTVCWALDSWDSVKVGITSREITQRVLSRVKPGDVVLLHIGSQATADALPAILQGLDARGLRVVPVSELMAG